MKRRIATSLVLCLSCWLVSTAWGQSSPVDRRPAVRVNGSPGQSVVRGDFQFEVVFTERSTEIFVFDRAGNPVRLQNVRGRIVFEIEDNRRTFRHDLYAPGIAASLPNRFYLAADLASLPDRGAVANVVLYGLQRRPIEFSTPFRRALTREQIAIQRQGICPVSGKRLGSMGQPARLMIGDREVFVCCAGCSAPLKKDPKRHLAKLPLPVRTGTRAGAIGAQSKRR